MELRTCKFHSVKVQLIVLSCWYVAFRGLLMLLVLTLYLMDAPSTFVKLFVRHAKRNVGKRIEYAWAVDSHCK